MRLRAFQAVPGQLDLPEEAIAYLADAGGNLLGEDTAKTGLTDPTSGRSWSSRECRSWSVAVTGPRLQFVAQPAAGARLNVLAGLPAPRWSWLERDLVIGIFAPILMLMLAVTAIWTASDLLIIRHIRTLATVARAYSRGRLELEPPMRLAPTELQELAGPWRAWPERIQQREAELRASVAQKDLLLARDPPSGQEQPPDRHEPAQSAGPGHSFRTGATGAEGGANADQGAGPGASQSLRARGRRPRSSSARSWASCATSCTISTADHAGIELSCTFGSARIATDRAIPLALFIAEAVSNAFKHAFPGGRDGRIEVSLRSDGQTADLVVADDGIGFDPTAVALAGGEPAAGIGMTLMELLAKQIGGTLKVETGPGTRFHLRFAVAPARAGRRRRHRGRPRHDRSLRPPPSGGGRRRRPRALRAGSRT